MRTVTRAIRLLFHLLQGAFTVWCILPRVTPAERGIIVAKWARKALVILNVRILWRGNIPSQAMTSTLFVCNHVSWLDILALLSVKPLRFVAKSEVRTWPMIGWMAMKTGTIFLHRSQSRQLTQVNRTIGSELARGRSIAVFPEGTTTDGTHVHPFHSGLFESAVVTGATIWPVALRYHQADGSLCKGAAFIEEQNLLSSLMQVLTQPFLSMTLSFGAPIQAGGWERRDLATAAYRAVTDLLDGHGQLVHPELVSPVSALQAASPEHAAA